MEQPTKKRSRFEAELRAARMRSFLSDIMRGPRLIVTDGAEDFDTSFGRDLPNVTNSQDESGGCMDTGIKHDMTRLCDKSIETLNKSFGKLISKAKGEGMPGPYHLSIVAPTSQSEPRREIWRTEVLENDQNEPYFPKNYPDFSSEHLNAELHSSEGMILSDYLNFTEIPATKLREAGALAAD